jgi:hypothetical protein
MIGMVVAGSVSMIVRKEVIVPLIPSVLKYILHRDERVREPINTACNFVVVVVVVVNWR